MCSPAAAIIAVFVSKKPGQGANTQHTIKQQDPEGNKEHDDLSAVPETWNENSITRQLMQLREKRPSLVPFFIESIQERFILRQDDRTAQTRLLFVRRQIEQLHLAKEYQLAIDDLLALSLERGKRIKELEIANQRLDHQKRTLSVREELEAKRDQKRLELEIAQIDKDIRALKVEQVGPTAEEQMQQRRARAQADYDRCLKSRKDWLSSILDGRNFDQLSTTEQEEYTADEMMWSDRIQKAREELSKHL